MPQITRLVGVFPASSRAEGGCNACTAHTGPDGAIEHRVWVIDLRGCSVRVCDGCLELLRTQLSVGMAHPACRRCAECAGSVHHWMPNPDFGDDPADADGPTDYPYQCKHCPALGRDCEECGGPDCGPADEGEDDAPPCPGCDGSGVEFMGWFIPRTPKEN